MSKGALLKQVFLPYVQNHTGQTLYEHYVEKRFQGIALLKQNAESQ